MIGPAVSTRRDLARYLQTQMIASRQVWAPEAEDLEVSGRTMVKTYLIEAHRDRAAEPNVVLDTVAEKLGLTIDATDDRDLYRVHAKSLDLWCDTSLGRFWRLHTIALVQEAGRLVDQMVAASPLLDNVWLPPDYLESLAERTKSEMETFSLNHDRRPLHAASVESADLDYLSLRLWSSRAGETLQRLRQAQVFPRGMSIRSVRLRAGDSTSDGNFCVAEYFHHGKVTVSGTSFDEHNRLLVHVLRDYRALVERIEDRYGIGIADPQGPLPLLRGEPIVIEMDWALADLEFAVGKMFSSTDPFRLWGVPERIAEGHYRARAVDLHVGETLSFEITPRHVTLLLPKGTCGNTVVRFLGSLHYHVNSEAGAALLQ